MSAALVSSLEQAGEGSPLNNARLAAELQAVALAIRIGGLEGLRSGAVMLTSTRQTSHQETT